MGPRCTVLLRGAGEMASGVALRLWRSGFPVILTEVEEPLAVRRLVSFSEAVWEGSWPVEGVVARRVAGPSGCAAVHQGGEIPLLVDPQLECLARVRPTVLVDATLAKRNTGLSRHMAPLVVALGPGFGAGTDAHVVVETLRGHDLGRLLYSGGAAPNTGVPAVRGGHGAERVLRAPAAGSFQAACRIGDRVASGQLLATAGGQPLCSAIDGLVRGLARHGVTVARGQKVGDVDAAAAERDCATVSDRARALGGSVLEAILAAGVA